MKMGRLWLLSCSFLFPALRSVAIADASGLDKHIRELASLTDPPAVFPAKEGGGDNGLRPVYFQALPYRGKPTRVFAWLGLPEKRTGKVPGIVLVHGGGGTAFAEWVKLWNEQGFAAISIAAEGQTDVRETAKGWQRHEWAGPARAGIYGDSREPLKDQWMFHAVADTILANSLLRSLPEVDADKIGVMGVSWGGVITSTAMGIDGRFAFAIPVYGCGHLSGAENQYGRALGDQALYREVWDPAVRLNRAKMPALWLSWPQDQHFPLDCQAASYRAAPGPRMVSLIPGMGHGHGPAWKRPESYAFAQSIVDAGSPWCRQLGASAGDGRVEATFSSARTFERAMLVSTTDTGITGARNWIESPAALTQNGDGWTTSAPLPEGTTAWFFNMCSGPLVASSDYQEARPRTPVIP